jgi:hypothetical protein
MRIQVTYKDHKFIALTDGAGLDVEVSGFVTDYTIGLASELWQAIYDTRISLHPKGYDWDTTSEELRESLKVLKLI